MKSAFDISCGEWKMDWPGRVARHDLVYLTPPWDPMQGIPLGNGEVGALVWCEDTRIVIAVNKSDLWDDAPFGRFHTWAAEYEELSTCLRHACRIIIDFGMPVFDLFYLSDFSGRLSLADASASMEVSGPFGSVSFRAVVDYDTGALCVDVKNGLNEEVPVEVTVERYGSRSFAHWYSSVNRDAFSGVSGTEASAEESAVFVSHRMRSGQFAVGCRIDGGKCLRKNSHAAGISVSEREFSIKAVVTGPMDEGAVMEARRLLGECVSLDSHKAAWKELWTRSLMECGDDYLDNLWHLTMYYAAASQRGKYPGRFINGLWTWNRDVQNWNFYFHWNQQQTYWPLNAAGFHDLCDSYLNYRFNSLPHAKKDAEECFGSDGAMVSDVAERRGYNASGEFRNHTPAAQIAMEFWRQYRFTKDGNFLREKALPYIIEAAKFFESLFVKEEDGKYHAKMGTGYEGWIELHDCISELVYAKVLFSAAISVLEEAGIVEPRAEKWREILENLAPLHMNDLAAGGYVDESGKLKIGAFKGDNPASDKVFAAGFGIKEERWLNSIIPDDQETPPMPDLGELLVELETNKTPYSRLISDSKCYDGIFPWVEYSAVFPSGLVGVGDRGSDTYNAAVNAVKLFSPSGMGWDVLPIAMARLGLAAEAWKVIREFPERWQFYPNGWGHYGPNDIVRCDAALRFRTNLAKDTAPVPDGQERNKFLIPTWNFRHMGMESMSVLACAMNEALLQSHGGLIRIVPAFDGGDARFTLHAEGGFAVSAEIRGGKPVWASIESKFGGVLRIENPWSEAFLYVSGEFIGPSTEGVIETNTSAGDMVFAAPEPGILEGWETETVSHNMNETPKESRRGMARLGLPRMF